MGKDKRFEIVAIAEPNQQVRDAARADPHLAKSRALGTLAEALDAVPADAVVICTPTKTHAELCRQAFAAGRHVLVEKGMTHDWEDAKKLVQEAHDARVKFCVAQNYRYGAGERAIGKMINDPSHPHHPGKVMIAEYLHHRYRPEPRTLNYPFAMVWDMGCHHLDSLIAWLGPVKAVTAKSSNPPWSPYEHDADLHATLEFESGCVCQYAITHAATISRWSVLLQGEQGALTIYDHPHVRFHPKPKAFLGSSDAVHCDVPKLPPTEQGVTDDFFRYLDDDVEPGISGRNNLRTLAACELLVRSAKAQRPVAAVELG